MVVSKSTIFWSGIFWDDHRPAGNISRSICIWGIFLDANSTIHVHAFLYVTCIYSAFYIYIHNICRYDYNNYIYIYMYMYDYWRIATIYISSTHIDLISESLPASAQEAAGLGSASRRSQAGGVWMAADGFPLKSHEEIVELASKWFHRHCEVDLPLLNGSTNKTMVS